VWLGSVRLGLGAVDGLEASDDIYGFAIAASFQVGSYCRRFDAFLYVVVFRDKMSSLNSLEGVNLFVTIES
jgi:hypothetical protein